VELIFILWLAFLGLCVGSFLNVVIARVPNDESVVRPRSKCPKCGHQLPWYENIPVFSWIALRGKCSGCKNPISPRYILVELLTGVLYMAALQRFDWSPQLLGALVFISLMIPLIFIDAEHWILPLEMMLAGIIFGLGFALYSGRIWDAVIGALIGFLTFRFMEFAGWYSTGKEALGAGDKYLLAFVGVNVGYQGMLGVIFFSSFFGAVYGLSAKALTGRAGPKAQEPQNVPSPTEPQEAPGEQEERIPFSPEFLKPNIPFWKRILLIPVTLFIQNIPDLQIDESTGEDTWQPEANSMPFGPWIGLAGIFIFLFGNWFGQMFPLAGMGRLLFG
jgi:leader peptidase (prepilin peptidase) / N-methyltransferase